jgi:hypothetical protein
MSRPKDAPKRGFPRVVYQRKEYVTIQEFASIFKRPRRTIDYLVNSGKLVYQYLPGYSAKYLNLKSESNRYNIWLEQQGGKMGRKIKEGAKYRELIDAEYFAPKSIGEGKTPEVPSIPTENEIKEQQVGGNVINLANINPEDYPDCLG